MELWHAAVLGVGLALVAAFMRWLRGRPQTTFHVETINDPADDDEDAEMSEEREEEDDEPTEPKFNVGDLVEHRATAQRAVVLASEWGDGEWLYDLDVGFDQSTVDGQPEMLLVLAVDQRLPATPSSEA